MMSEADSGNARHSRQPQTTREDESFPLVTVDRARLHRKMRVALWALRIAALIMTAMVITIFIAQL